MGQRVTEWLVFLAPVPCVLLLVVAVPVSLSVSFGADLELRLRRLPCRTATNPTMIPRLASVVAPMKPEAVYACTVHPDGR